MDTALYNGQRINILDYNKPKIELEKDKLRCKFCDEPLFIKHGEIKRKHFCHYSDSACEFEKRQGEPETEEHRLLKREATKLAEKIFAEDDIQIEPEEPINKGKRIADIMIIHSTGFRTVFECQVSPITVGEIKKRSADYHAQGIDVIWLIKDEILKEPLQDALIESKIHFYSVSFLIKSSSGKKKLIC